MRVEEKNPDEAKSIQGLRLRGYLLRGTDLIRGLSEDGFHNFMVLYHPTNYASRLAAPPWSLAACIDRIVAKSQRCRKCS